MKIAKTKLITLLGLTISFGVHAQSVVTGTNLNIGADNTINNNGSNFVGNAIGNNNFLEAASSLTVGYMDTITTNAYNSAAFGSVNKVAGNSSIAVGSNVKVLKGYSMGIGRHIKVAESYSVVIGNGITNPGVGPDVMLESPYSHSLMIGFLSSKPTFTVSPSPNTFGNVVNRTGKIAIGDVPVPDIAAKLHIRSDQGEDAGIILEPKDPENSSTFIQMRDTLHGITVDGMGLMSISSCENPMELLSANITLSGKVGINTTNESDTYTLAVNGGILTNEVLIKEVDEWYDAVFAKDYRLLSLNELRQYIDGHGHLPEIPSESEVKSEGYRMAEMQGLLLKKIEELTLYTLKQQEYMERLEQRIKELEGK